MGLTLSKNRDQRISCCLPLFGFPFFLLSTVMSAPHSNSHSASSSSGDLSDLPFAPTLRKILVVMGIGFIVPIILLLLIAYYIGSSSQPPAGSEALATAAVNARIAPAGSAAVAGSSEAAAQQNAASMSTVAATPAASGSATAATPAGSGSASAMPVAAAKVDGKSVYESTCIACHGAGVAGAPKVGDKAAWAPIIAQGDAVLYDRAIHGYTGKRGVMPPKGGSTASDDEVKAAVDYMVSQSK
ncbi:MAG: c-type cytochrome [Thiomonas sp.]|uniref:c-type cytochrome n=1 Tax=Thiomonas sp. TaxID=2047785 RepID=UPI002A367118|nr:c-type cytochrome [Thiomonas sp.]MDY0331080.1 c-type cytochrome [Thiomonas sp.]